MALPFTSRLTAADELSDRLTKYRERDDVTVVGLPRGGIPIAARVAVNLGIPLEALVIEKIRLGRNRVHGAVANGEMEISGLNNSMGFSPDSKTLARAREDALRTLAAKEAHYGRPLSPPLPGRCAMIIDDGIASGLTMLAAARVAKRDGAKHVILAAPVASPHAAEMLKSECDEMICLAIPKPFNSLSECYLDFEPLSDETCADILRSLARKLESHE